MSSLPQKSAPEKVNVWDLFLRPLAGTAMIGFAVWLYFDLAAFEQAGGEKRINWLLALLYNVGGKWAASGFLGIVGVVVLVFSILKLIEVFTPRDKQG